MARGHVVTWQHGFVNDTAESGSAVSTAYQSQIKYPGLILYIGFNHYNLIGVSDYYSEAKA